MGDDPVVGTGGPVGTVVDCCWGWVCVARSDVVEVGSLAWLSSMLGARAAGLVGEVILTAGGGAITWSSTTETPAQAMPTPAALAASHITKSINFFMTPVSPVGPEVQVNHTLNEP